ncbi:MAG: hypothetical protein KC619_31370 [Myxococcales bacterium]|nr:hypothetical protein [Myxococcales bacterium]
MRQFQAFLAALALFVAATVAAPSAEATTFVDVTVEQLAAASDLIVVGRVVEVSVEPQGPAGQPGIHTRATVQVEEVLRGPGRSLVDVWVQGGRLGDRMRVVPGQAQFVQGEDLVLFLTEAGGGLWPTGMGRGKWQRPPDSSGFSPQSPLRDGPHLAPALTLQELRRVAAREATR